MDTLTKYLAVAAGGAAGSMLRYYISLSGLSRIAQPFPAATFVINITGSFIIGFFLTLVTERIPINPHVRLAFTVGFVGAYTTFSTLEYETARLIEAKDFVYALLYVVLSFVVGFGAVWAGIVLAREVEHVPAVAHTAGAGFMEQTNNSGIQSGPRGSVSPMVIASEQEQAETDEIGDKIQ